MCQFFSHRFLISQQSPYKHLPKFAIETGCLKLSTCNNTVVDKMMFSTLACCKKVKGDDGN